MHKSSDPNRDYITTPEAARRSGLTRIYLAHLLRRGTLEGFHLGRDWLVYTDSLEQFLATPRKPGPKGPRKGPSEQHPTTSLTSSGSDQQSEDR